MSVPLLMPMYACRWALDQGVPVIPKSVRAARIEENWEGVRGWTLSEAQRAEVDRLGSTNLKFAWDPSKVA